MSSLTFKPSTDNNLDNEETNEEMIYETQTHFPTIQKVNIYD